MFDNGIKYVNDYVIDEYKPQIQAFLNRRWTTKREIHPKISILTQLKEYRQTFFQQKTASLDVLYEWKHLHRLYDADAVNTQYVQSIFFEPYEKQMYDAFL